MGKGDQTGEGGIGNSLKSSLSKFTGRVSVKAPSAEKAPEVPQSKPKAPSPLASQPKPMTAPTGNKYTSQTTTPSTGPAPVSQKVSLPTSAATTASVAPESRAPASDNINKLGNDVHIEGNLRFANRLTFAGRLKGEIKSDGALAVQSQAVVEANVTVKSLLVEGKIVGNILATESVRLSASAVVIGDITTASLSIEPNTSFSGQAKIGQPTGAALQAPKQPTSENSPTLPSGEQDSTPSQHPTSQTPAPPSSTAEQGDLL